MGQSRETRPIALSRGSIRGCSYRLELDFGPGWECPGLEGQPGRRLGRVGKLPTPPVVDVAVVADVAEQHLHVQQVVGAGTARCRDSRDAGPGTIGFFFESSGDELAVRIQRGHPADEQDAVSLAGQTERKTRRETGTGAYPLDRHGLASRELGQLLHR